MYDVSTGQNSQVAAHDAPIKCIAYIDMPNGSGQNGVLVTAGWDKKLKVCHASCGEIGSL
jgi:mRNA export factor